MKPRKKNTFLTYVFSFVPGAAEMYMGFMKSGLSLLVAFVIPFIVTGMLYEADYIVMLSGIIYCVAFFHAINIATAPDDEFCAFEDKFIWEEYLSVNNSGTSPAVYKKWSAVALIFFGACGIWSLFRDGIFRMLGFLSERDSIIVKSVLNNTPRLVFSVLIIVFGIKLIRGKKKTLTEESDK